jgi:organic radical activating enzyme
LPEGRWNEEHLVITGGEPLLGWQKAYVDLLEHPKMKPLKHITFETNGTQKLNSDFRSYFNTRFKNNKKRLTFSVSPKLSVSGEKWEDAIKHKVVDSYRLMGDAYLKFVIATQDDVKEVKKAVDQFNSTVPESFEHNDNFYDIPKYDVYVMPCGGDEDMYNLNKGEVANIAMKNGWRYSDRLQIPLFKNAWGT